MAGEHYKHTRGQRWTSLMANAEIKAGDFFGVVKVTQAIFVDVPQCIGDTAEGPVDITIPSFEIAGADQAKGQHISSRVPPRAPTAVQDGVLKDQIISPESSKTS